MYLGPLFINTIIGILSNSTCIEQCMKIFLLKEFLYFDKHVWIITYGEMYWDIFALNVKQTLLGTFVGFANQRTHNNVFCEKWPAIGLKAAHDISAKSRFSSSMVCVWRVLFRLSNHCMKSRSLETSMWFINYQRKIYLLLNVNILIFPHTLIGHLRTEQKWFTCFEFKLNFRICTCTCVKACLTAAHETVSLEISPRS